MTQHLDLDALQAAAEAAGGEPWSAEDDAYVWHGDGDAVCRCFTNIGHMPEPLDDTKIAAFIAAANPSVVLALIDRLRKAEAQIDAMRSMLREMEAIAKERGDAYLFDAIDNDGGFYQSGYLAGLIAPTAADSEGAKG